MSDHALIVLIGVIGTLIELAVLGFVVGQVREMRRESQRFWTATGGTLIQLWRHLDPAGAAKFDREMGPP
jgi:hypothetical protein